MKTEQNRFRQSLILSFLPSLLLGILFYSNNPHLVHFDSSVVRFLGLLSFFFFIWIFLLKKISFFPYLPLGFSSAFCFLVLFQKVDIPYKNSVFLYILSLFFALFIYLLRKYIKIIFLFFSILLFSQTVQFFLKYDKRINIRNYEKRSKNFDLSIKKYNKTLKRSYSVYYLLVDSYPSFEALKKHYHIDNSPFMNYLEKQEFFTNKNVYSNYSGTYASMQATFQMRHNYYEEIDFETTESHLSRYIMAGANPVMGRFYNNSFSVYINPYNDKINIKQQISHFKKWNGKIENRIDLDYTKQDIYWFLRYFNLIRSNPDEYFDQSFNSKNMELVPLEENINKENDLYWKKIKKINIDSEPRFVYIHFHLTYDYKKCKSKNGKQTFIAKLKCVNQDLKKTINYLLKNDPDSIIILQADHGWSGGGQIVYELENHIETAFGILFSVRWPEECKYLGKEKYTPINLFPRVFACLNGEKPDYKNMAKDDSYWIGKRSPDKSRKSDEVFKVIENNEILPEFK